MKKTFCFATAIFAGLVCLTGCAGKFDLNFMVDGHIYETIRTNGKEIVEMPKDPTKDNYTFEGWYWDNNTWKKEFTQRSLLDTPLSSNMEVYAHFVDDIYLWGTDINIKGATKKNLNGVGEVFYLPVRNNQSICKFNDYVQINPHSTWILSSDIGGNNTINSKTVELTTGDNPFYYIYVTDKDGNHETYAVLVHRNYLFNVYFDGNGGTSPSSQRIEEGYYLTDIPTSSRTGYTFNGWNYDFRSNPITSNITAKAKWQGNEYVVTLNPNGGTVSQTTVRVTYGSSYSLPTPTRKGYMFKGWSKNGGYIFPATGNWSMDGDITLTAQWEAIEYIIEYELNGGTASEALKTSYTIEDSFVLPSASRKGYTFNGWSTSAELSGASLNVKILKGTTGNKRYYAKFTANSYTITYDVNGGDEFEDNNQEVTYDSSFSLLTPTRTGYDFQGWYAGGQKVTDGSKWGYDSNKTLTAHWTLHKYSISYELNGGDNNNLNPSTYTIESSDISILDPTRKGYTFDGWTSNEIVSPTKNPAILSGSIGDKQFAAHWSANTYTITFDVNTGDNLPYTEKQFTYDSDVTLDVPTKRGYTFAGWYYDGSLIVNGKWKIAKDCTLTAKWTVNQYTITKHNGDGSGTSTVAYGSDYSLGISGKTGYDFHGWYAGENGEGTQYTDSDGNSLNKYNETNGIDLYAYFTYDVTFETNGGNSLETVTYKENEHLSEAIVAVKKDRTFGGWYLDAELTKPVSYGDSLGKCTLFAKWDEEVAPSLLTYSLIDDKNEYEISCISSTASSLILPDYIGGIPVTSVSDYDGEDNITAAELIIPDSVTTIYYLFHFKKLESVTLPFVGIVDNCLNYNRHIGAIFGSRQGKYSYEDETTDSVVAYMKSSSYTPVNGSYWTYPVPKTLKHVVITKSSYLPAAAFMGCSFESVAISNAVSAISEYAFKDCASLKRLNSDYDGTFNIPESATIIGESAFEGCAGVTCVNTPQSVSEIGIRAFEHCSSIMRFNSSDSGHLIIPESCRVICANAFWGLSSITDVLIPNSVEQIGDESFAGVLFFDQYNIAIHWLLF